MKDITITDVRVQQGDSAFLIDDGKPLSFMTRASALRASELRTG